MFKPIDLQYILALLFMFFYLTMSAQEVKAIDNKGTITKIRNNTVTTSDAQPTNPLESDVWFDTSLSETVLVKVWDGNTWKKINNNNTIGDVKSGVQTADHNGWVKLDGRLINTLSATQQQRATALGFSGSLPNATNAYLTQNGAVLGSVTGTNTRTIARNQLPQFTLGGTTNDAGSHTYVDVKGSYSASSNAPATVNHWAVVNNIAATIPSHNHSITTDNINNTGSQQNLDITPASLSVNVFIFLGD